MKASELIEILQKTPDLEVKVIEIKLTDEEIPSLSFTNNFKVIPNEYGENELILTVIQK